MIWSTSSSGMWDDIGGGGRSGPTKDLIRSLAPSQKGNSVHLVSNPLTHRKKKRNQYTRFS